MKLRPFIDMKSNSISGISKLRLMQIVFRGQKTKGLLTRVQYLSFQIFIFYSIKNIC